MNLELFLHCTHNVRRVDRGACVQNPFPTVRRMFSIGLEDVAVFENLASIANLSLHVAEFRDASHGVELLRE